MSSIAGAEEAGGVASVLQRAISERRDAGADFFRREAPRIARCCHRMAERFAHEGRLIALGPDPAARSDARHVSVEFVHPVIVGKRALPAIALTGEGGPLVRQLDGLAAGGDIVIGFGLDGEVPAGDEARRALALAADRGCMTIAFGTGGPGGEDSWVFDPRSPDPAIRQELIETLYHVLWELVHVFFDHRGLLEGRSSGPTHDGGEASFLYPFLSEGESDVESVLADVEASVLMKSEEVGELRAQTLGDGADVLAAGAAAIRASDEAGGRVLAFGNGGSATDAMDLVADLRLPTREGWAPRRALDLTEDTPIITAVANDIGVEEIFQRQLIAYGREGDVAVAFSTSGGSENLIEGLAEARRRGLVTIAMVGYDGGRIASQRLADHVIVSRSQHIPRIQEAQASAYHLLRELVETARRGEMSPAVGTIERRSARVEGTVQGVGFRPYVHALASELGLGGFILNDERGVLVEVEGDPATIESFLERLPAQAPPLARVESVVSEAVEPRGEDLFTIAPSRDDGVPRTQISPDAATCDDCLAEVRDPADRRYRYPFTNCTNCGPRFTIVTGIPYDRPQTTMAGFEMCDRCRREYEDPADRRFHAQPNACPECGPSLRLLTAAGEEVAEPPDAVAATAEALVGGLIVAVKGVGGYHLACRADREEAVAELRSRKRREEKPFALMARDLEAAERLIELGEAERGLLCGPERPIVVARRRSGSGSTPVADSVAPGNPDLGVMLPYSPLHSLLLDGAGVDLVMTSANLSDEPIAYRDEDARARLAGIADRFCVHDRPIHIRTDDSVVRALSAEADGRPLLLRRSRGWVPRSLPLGSPPRPPCSPAAPS